MRINARLVVLLAAASGVLLAGAWRPAASGKLIFALSNGRFAWTQPVWRGR